MIQRGSDAVERRFTVPGRSGSPFVLSWAARTDIGHRRQLNEDSVLAEPPVFAVADGMGGHSAGDRASAAAVSRLAEATSNTFLEVSELDAALRLAVSDIDVIAEEYTAGAGTTVTGVALALFEETPGLLVFNIGDSRVYAFAEDRMERITVDHSVVQELVDAGMIDAASAESHPESNVITRALGFHETPRPDLWGVPLRNGLRILICSDGLTREVDDERLAQVLAERAAPAETAETLVALALQAGGRDNVTVIVLDVVKSPARGRRQARKPSTTSRPSSGAEQG
ncbi:PP2C family serine/threonine-protein phosphatase [uncultured Schumannella sp.]|uniref:PP2C family protein-serine/threonine phosphatase n=1 Tax=uncultured Schumannella sp. TaxID=1195956 RepID=UPI0025DE3EF0|nr:protein phosphatase 2C domain-containing protein [uncultured Schumannella sp.]